MEATIIGLFVGNAIAHIVSYQKLRQAKAPNSMGVLAFVFINAAIAILLWQKIEWAIWPALIFPTIGGMGLLLTTLREGDGTWIDYTILALDIFIIILTVKIYSLLGKYSGACPVTKK